MLPDQLVHAKQQARARVSAWSEMKRIWTGRTRLGGSSANEQLTAIVAAVLLPLLAAEGATLLNVTALLNVHAFVGMLLVPIVGVKLASTGWRMMRYDTGGEEYVRHGPPHAAITRRASSSGSEPCPCTCSRASRSCCAR